LSYGKTIFFHHLLEFTLHQRTQQENRKKPSVDIDVDTNTDLDEGLDDIVDEDPATTMKNLIKSTSTKNAASSKSKSKNGEGMHFNIILFFSFKMI
jgi:hypothetical protein